MSAQTDERCSDCGTALGERHKDRLTDDWLCWRCFVRRPDPAAPDEDEDEESPATSSADDAVLAPIPAYPVEALPPEAQTLVALGVDNGLPAALVAGASLGAMASAVGSRSTVKITSSWVERLIVWPVLIAPPGAGKSPALRMAMDPLRAAEVNVLGDMTFEALARALYRAEGTGALCVDELAHFLNGLGQYKGGSGGDRSKLLELWDGAPWNVERVGNSKGEDNGLVLRIAQPTLVVCGGLQPHLQDLLGSETDGFRARWLPHLVEMPVDLGLNVGVQSSSTWEDLIGALVAVQGNKRQWTLSPAARLAWENHRDAWKRTMREAEPAGVINALSKGDRHVLRIAGALAEAEHPGAGRAIGPDVIEKAAAIVDYTLDCWRALPDNSGLGLSRREEKLVRAVERWREWLEARPEREATRGEIMRAHVGGVRKAKDFDVVLEAWQETYPGTVREETRSSNTTTVVKAPARAPVT